MNNPPAFPTGIITDEKGKIIGGSNGMTLRDYFAAKAMTVCNVLDIEASSDLTDQIAAWSYKMADAMLKAREQ